MLAIARALLTQPTLLLLDDPSSGLDPLLQRELVSLIEERVADGATVFLSPHVLPEVERIARAALELRYRLLPYLYTAFRISAETGAPVQRPLVFDFQDDPRTPAIDDEFMLGDADPVLVLTSGALAVQRW